MAYQSRRAKWRWCGAIPLIRLGFCSMQTDINALWSSTCSQQHIWTPWLSGDGVPENICEALFLSLLLHPFLPLSPSDLWYLFLGTSASLTWSGIGYSSFWKTPTGLPSVCGSGRMGIPDIWSHQFKGTPLHFHCAVEIQIEYICFLEQYLFQWQMNKCNLTLFIINDIGVYSPNLTLQTMVIKSVCNKHLVHKCNWDNNECLMQLV